MEENIEELFSKAINKRNEGGLKESTEILFDIIARFTDEPRLVTVYAVLGGVLRDQSRWVESLHFFKKALALNPSLELASLGIYLNYVELEQYDNAIGEMERFLDQCTPDMYLVPLQELMGDLKNGYARDHEAVIIRLMRKYNLSF